MKTPPNTPTTPRKAVTAAQKAKKPFEIEIDYRPAPDLRTNMVSGALSTLTPERLIQLAIYVERRSFPVSTTITVNRTDGSAEEEDKHDGNPIVREIVHSLLMDDRTAEYIISVLQGGLNDFREFKESKPKK